MNYRFIHRRLAPLYDAAGIVIGEPSDGRLVGAFVVWAMLTSLTLWAVELGLVVSLVFASTLVSDKELPSIEFVVVEATPNERLLYVFRALIIAGIVSSTVEDDDGT